MMKTTQAAACGMALVLSVSWFQAAQGAAKEPAAKPDLSDEILAKGKACEVKRSQLDEAFILLKANAAARGQTIPETDRQKIEAQLLDRLVFTQLLLAKSNETDKAKGREVAEKIITAYKTNALSEESFNRQIKAVGLTPEKFRAQMIEQGICEQVLDRELKDTITITDADAKKFYEENSAGFEQPEKIRAAHILISTKDSATNQDFSLEKKKEKKKLAETVLQRAKKGEDFGKLAKEFSDDPGSKDAGGEYTFPRGQMVPEFEAAAFSMKTNQISDLVETTYGYHIIKLYERFPSQKAEYAKVEKEIKERLQLLEIQKRLPDYLDKLKKEAGVEMAGEKSKSEDTKK
jgi:foldase protein PrsA